MAMVNKGKTMKEKILEFLRKILNIQRPSQLVIYGNTPAKHNCVTCMYGDFGYCSGPCRECNGANKFIHYKEEK